MSEISKTAKSILVVEDEPALLEILTKRIAASGYTIQKARDGQEAIEIAKKKIPDAVVTDIIMPRKNGFDLIQELKRIKPDIPIIVVTNLESQQDRETCQQLGVKHFVIKSNISLRELDGMIARELA